MVIYLNKCPSILGHVFFRGQDGERIDSFAGPREAMISIYLAAGYDVRDESGSAIACRPRATMMSQ